MALPAGQSVIQPRGEYSSSCGYCGSEAPTKQSFGASALQLTCESYQRLIDHKWRRSGKFMYHPSFPDGCCTHYTIRMDALGFVPDKAHRAVMRRMRRFLHGVSAAEEAEAAAACHRGRRASSCASVDEQRQQLRQVIADALASAARELGLAGVVPPDAAHIKVMDSKLPDFQFASSIALQLAAALRKAGGAAPAQSLAERIVPATEAALHAAEALPAGVTLRGVRAVNGFVNIALAGLPDAAAAAEAAAPAAASAASSNAVEHAAAAPRHRLTLTMEPASFTEEKFLLFQRYQTTVHKEDDVTPKSFRRFLVDTPLLPERDMESAAQAGRATADAAWAEVDCAEHAGSACAAADRVMARLPDDGAEVADSCSVVATGLGSMHCLYRLDGKLVAVGVLDVLPHCLSSVYAMYDPDYGHLSLGKFMALKEIQWVLQAHKHLPSLRYYYLGYYIHTCPKMRYKAEYGPAQLLCPATYRWVSLPDAVARLASAGGGVRIAPDDVPAESLPARAADTLVLWLRGEAVPVTALTSGSRLMLQSLLDSLACRLGPYALSHVWLQF